MVAAGEMTESFEVERGMTAAANDVFASVAIS